jgi:hypothetical protein
LVLHFSDFSAIFYAIYNNQQDGLTIWVTKLQEGPRKEVLLCNVVPETAGRHGSPESGELACACGRESPFRTEQLPARISPKIWIEVHKVMNTKVVDLTTLYNFCKGLLVFFSTDFAGTSCQHWMSACSGKQEVLSTDQVFHRFPLKIWNANLHESCVPQQDGQLS